MSGSRAIRRVTALAALVVFVGTTVWMLGQVDPTGEPTTTTTPVVAETTSGASARARVAVPAPEPVPPRAIRVAVKSLDGRPVAGARVELVPGPSESMFLRFDVPSVVAPVAARTSAAGDDAAVVFDDVPAGRWFVVATAPGFARHVLGGVERAGDDVGVDASVALDRGHVFAGTIHSPDGAPASGVAVVLEPVPPTVMWRSDVTCLRTRTAGDGTYRFDGVEPGTYRLWTEVRPGLLVEHERVLVPSLDGLDVALAHGADVEGTLRDAGTGEVIPGARVFAVHRHPAPSSGSPDRTTVLDVGATDGAGRFALHTWRRACTLSGFVVDAEGYAPAPVADDGEGMPGTLGAGQRAAFEVRLRRSVTLTGTVSGPDGPLAGMVVRVTSDAVRNWPRRAGDAGELAWSNRSNPTTSDGRFRLDRLPPGECRLAIFDAVTGDCLDSEDVVLPDERDVVRDVSLRLLRGAYARRVVDAHGEPVAGVEVSADLSTFHSRAVSDAAGQFTLDLLRCPYPTRLRLRRSGWRTTETFDHGGEDGSDLYSFFPFEPVSDLAGAIVRPDGTPVAGTRVALSVGSEENCGSTQSWSGTCEAYTGANGEFRVPITGGPHHWLRIPSSGSLEWFREDEREPGPLRVTLAAPVHVAGVVTTADGGEPVRGALLRCGEDVVAARTDAAGRFVAEIPAGQAHGLRVSADGSLSAPVARGVADVRVTLRPALGVSGAVQLADGTPVPGLEVTVRRLDRRPGDPGTDADTGDDESSAYPTSATDAAGRFVVSGLEPGAYEVAVNDPERFVHTAARAPATAGSTNLLLAVEPAVRLDVKLDLIDHRGPTRPSRVTATPAGRDLPTEIVTTDYHGRVSLAVLRDVEYTIRAEHDGLAPAVRTGIRGGGTTPLRIDLRPAPTPR